MRFVVPILALAALPACMGGGGGSSVGPLPSSPSASMNASMGTLMNNVRSDAFLDLEYNAGVGQAAQDHVNDMLVNDYLSISGSFDDGMGGTVVRDGADTAAQVYGVTWNDFIQMIAQGDGTVNTVFNQWSASGSEGNGNNEIAFNSALDDENFDEFGIARAGSGDDTRWMLIILDR